MKKIIIFIILMMIFTACQPTPENETVSQKDSEQLMELIEEDNTESTPEPYSAPEKWEESLSLLGDKVKVTIEAEIDVPDVTAYPVIRIEPDKFTIDDFYAVEKLFFPDCSYYAINSPTTKEEYEALILMFEKSINDPNSDFNSCQYSEAEYQTRLQEKQAAIEGYKKLIQSAPYESELETVTVTEELLYDNTFDLLVKAISQENEVKAQVFINANSYENMRINCIDISVYLRNPEDTSHWVMRKLSENSDVELFLPPALTITEEEAIVKAEEAINALGITDMDLNYCYKLLSGDSEAYELFFTKTYSGIPSNYAANGSEYSEYTFDYRPELIHIRVNDDGIITFRWYSPSREVEILNESVELLSFDQIQEIARNQLNYRFAWDEEESDVLSDANVLEKRVVIDEIKLGMMRVSMPNSVDEYMIVPVWDFYGHFDKVYSPDMADELQLALNEDGELIVEEYNDTQRGTSLFTINAIDGSIVHRYEGD